MIAKLGLAIVLVVMGGCSKTNANYCASAPEHNCSLADGGGSDAPQGCSAPGQCTSPNAMVCDLGKHECVECMGSNATCPSMAPICNTDETCRKCVAHSECGSPGACLPDGTCGSDANVAWVSSSGANAGACNQALPCATITYALTQLAGRKYIKVATGGFIQDTPSIGTDVTILADPGAQLKGGGSAAVTITGSSNVTVQDLRISGSAFGVLVNASASPNVTLDHVIIDGNSGPGVSISGGMLTMSRCVLSVNSGGGAIVTAAFDITNSIFVANGNGGSSTGGLTLSPVGSQSAFRFNTVADNLSSGATASIRGINCVIPFAMTSDIVTGNLTSGSCTFDYSLFDVTPPSGAHSKMGDPAFVNIDTADPTATTYYRIKNTSAAIDSADSASSIAVDIDDQMRPSGSGYDIGASELKQ